MLARFDPASTAWFLDVDGTLVDLAPTPDGVTVPATLPSLLERLSTVTSGALALVSGMDIATATTIGVILGSVAVLSWNAYMSINALWVHAADRYLAAGNIKMVRVCNYVPSFFVSLILNGLPALLIVLVGKAFGDWLTTFPQWIMDLFAIAGGILPALGIGMLLNYLGKKKIIPFFFLGFALAKFMGLSTMMITAIGAIVAILLYNFSDNTAKKVGA